MTVGQKMVLPLKIKNSQILPTGFTVMRVLPVTGKGPGQGEGDDDMSFTSLGSEDNNDGNALRPSSSGQEGEGGGGEGGVDGGTAADEHKVMDQPLAQGQGLDPSTGTELPAGGVSAGTC